jgi:hypothetical protein
MHHSAFITDTRHVFQSSQDYAEIYIWFNIKCKSP